MLIVAHHWLILDRTVDRAWLPLELESRALSCQLGCSVSRPDWGRKLWHLFPYWAVKLGNELYVKLDNFKFASCLRGTAALSHPVAPSAPVTDRPRP